MGVELPEEAPELDDEDFSDRASSSWWSSACGRALAAAE